MTKSFFIKFLKINKKKKKMKKYLFRDVFRQYLY